MLKEIKIPRADYPEQVGVSSAELEKFFEKLDETQYHGFMLIKDGKVIAERFRRPYNASNLHAMYSVSKSVTATAVGFAVSEGLISLDTRVIDVLTEYAPKKKDEVFDKLNLGHLISLSSGISVNPAVNKSRNKDWIKLFMTSKKKFLPGEGFEYINENFYMACAMLQRVTGETVVDYLYPRLFEPLGIEKPFWESCEKGIESGGWGLFMSLESMAKIGLCYLNGGKYDGKQIIPEEWVKTATTNHKDPQYNEMFNDLYGYGIWIRNGVNAFRFDGMYSQAAEMYPDYNAMAVMIGGDFQGSALSVTMKAFPDLFKKEVLTCEKEAFEKISMKKGNDVFAPYPPSKRYEREKEIDSKTIKFRKHFILSAMGMPLSLLSSPTVFLTKDRAGNINNCMFRFGEKSCDFTWTEGDEKNTVKCGMDGEYEISPIRLASKNYNAYSTAFWDDENTLLVKIRPIESVDTRMFRFTFDKKKVKMKPSSEMTIENTVLSIKWFIRTLVRNDKLTEKICKIMCDKLEPIHKGVMK